MRAAGGSALSVDIRIATAVAVSLSTGFVHVSMCVYLWWSIYCTLSSDHSMISEIPVSHWPMCNELGSQVSFDSTRNSLMAKVGLELPYQRLLLPDQGGEQEIITHPLRVLEDYLPEL